MKFAICVRYIDEVLIDVVPLKIYGVIIGNSYMQDKVAIYYIRLNKLRLVKDGKVFLASANNNKKKLPLVTAS